MGVRAGLSGSVRRRMIAQVRREEPCCWLCGWPIDLRLPVNHPMSSTVDEVVPRSLSADPKRAATTRENLRHAHMRCNSSRGNGTRKRGATRLGQLSRTW